MSEIKRWLIYAHDWNEDAHELGDWVKFTDHEKEIKRLEAELDKLKRANEIMKGALETYAKETEMYDDRPDSWAAKQALKQIEAIK